MVGAPSANRFPPEYDTKGGAPFPTIADLRGRTHPRVRSEPCHIREETDAEGAPTMRFQFD